MLMEKSEKAKKPSDKQKVLLETAKVLGTKVEPKAQAASGKKGKATTAVAEPEPPTIWQLTDALGQAADTTKTLTKHFERVEQLASSVPIAKDAVAELKKLAQHPALDGQKGTAEGLETATAAVATVEKSFSDAQAQFGKARIVVQKALASHKPASGAGKTTQQRLKAKLDANRAKDAVATKALDEAMTGFAETGKLADDAQAKLTELTKDWQKLVQSHAKKQQEAEALAAAKETYTAKMEAFDQAGVDKLVEQAKALKLTAPDFATMKSGAETAGKKEDWKAAGGQATALVAAVERLRRVVEKTTTLKADFETARKETEGAVNRLTKTFSAAQVHDTELLTTLSGLQKSASQAAKDGNWAQASELLEEFGERVEDATELAKKFAVFTDSSKPRLLTGTILAAKKALPKDATNDQVLARLQELYEKQCRVKRNDWLTHLQIAGSNVKVGSDSDHYTTFNDSVPVGTDVTVLNRSVAQVCAALFEVALPNLRIHATFVDGLNRYHRYWSSGGASYSANVVSPNPWAKLDTRFNQMVADMSKRVKEVVDLHGRIGANALGPTV